MRCGIESGQCSLAAAAGLRILAYCVTRRGAEGAHRLVCQLTRFGGENSVMLCSRMRAYRELVVFSGCLPGQYGEDCDALRTGAAYLMRQEGATEAQPS